MEFLRNQTIHRRSFSGFRSPPLNSKWAPPTPRRNTVSLDRRPHRRNSSTAPFLPAVVANAVTRKAKEEGLLEAARQARLLGTMAQLIFDMLIHSNDHVPNPDPICGIVGKYRGFYCKKCNMTWTFTRSFGEHFITEQHLNAGQPADAMGYNQLIEAIWQSKSTFFRRMDLFNDESELRRLVMDCVAALKRMKVNWEALGREDFWTRSIFTRYILAVRFGNGIVELFDLDWPFGFRIEENWGDSRRPRMVEYRPNKYDTPLPGQRFFRAANVFQIGYWSAWPVLRCTTPDLWVRQLFPRTHYTGGEETPVPVEHRRGEVRCGICLMSFDEPSIEIVAVRQCKHIFCGRCLDTWCDMEREASITVPCPLCRGIIGWAPSTLVHAYKRCKDTRKVPSNYWAYEEIVWWKAYLEEKRERPPSVQDVELLQSAWRF
ncbi:Homeobox protein B-H1 [Didymosphaeria variabile]|uniref:Homeobox protein B-H1 n=1 Tax=Didymosphaeria variabile TaxID=1932322 RepID=A0A9W8XQC7_9PLEO|nr:Homeobox protein B-H1 [Didymosphaeria variabile]KAJ4355626.1 Homeobox protein B-H1 [Didymosphaeria variabile]